MITFNEYERAKILEAILLTESLYESRYEKQDEIHEKIKELTNSKPVVLHESYFDE